MLWADLTSDGLADAARRCDGLCLLPFGCIERHGSHLPLGTDQIVADAVARAAAGREPAVVFASYPFGKIFTARHCRGTFSLSRRLLRPLFEATIAEIERNGFHKVLVCNGHGGNTSMLRYFLRALLEVPRECVVYSTDYYVLEGEARTLWEEMRETDYGDHADERETSVMLHLRPDLVKMDAVPPPEEGRSTGRTGSLEGLYTSASWYAEHPTHYAGDARAATAEKGEFLFGAFVEKVTRQMRAIKADRELPRLQREFYSESGRL